MTDASVPNVVFKFFSPLRPPLSPTESPSTKKRKKKPKHESNQRPEKLGKDKPSREKEITGDILSLASHISQRLAQKDRENLDSDTGSFDFNISPKKARLLNARLAGCPIENKFESAVFCRKSIIQSQNNDSEFPVPVIEQFSVQMKENISSEKMGRKIHAMSPSPEKADSESLKKKKKTLGRDNNPLHKESGKQKARKSVTITTNGGKDSESSGSDKDSVISNGDNFVASRSDKDNVTSESDNESDNDSPEKEEESVASSSDDESVASEKDSIASEGNVEEMQKASVTQTPKKTRYKIKPGFSEVVKKEGKTLYICEEDLKDKEVWLIKAPYDIKVENLTNQKIQLGEMSSVNIKETNEAFDILPHKNTSGLVSTFCPVLPSKKLWKYRAGCRIVGQVHINKTIKVPPLPSFTREAPKRIEIPSGLKQRYQPFGANPQQCKDLHSVKKHKKKSKKRKNDEDSIQCTEASKKMKKSKKSKKHDDAEVEVKHKKKKKKHKA